LTAPKPKRVLIVPDTHAPWHNRLAWDLMIKVAKDFKPNVIVCLGDLIDLYSVSSYNRNPNRPRNVEYEVEIANSLLRELESLGARERYFIAGNHEWRLERYLTERAPELFNIVKIEELLQLRQHEWNYTPYKGFVRLGKMVFTHDLGKSGRYAVHSAVTDAQHSIVIGHLHRLCYLIEGDVFGQPRLSFCPGWLGDATKADYMHELRAKRDWATGFAVSYWHPDGIHNIVPVPIVHGTAFLNGKVYR